GWAKGVHRPADHATHDALHERKSEDGGDHAALPSADKVCIKGLAPAGASSGTIPAFCCRLDCERSSGCCWFWPWPPRSQPRLASWPLPVLAVVSEVPLSICGGAQRTFT